jgi:hypothetical protein
MWKIKMEQALIASTPADSKPSRNQAARRRVSGLGWVIPKVLKKADARASSRRMVGFYGCRVGSATEHPGLSNRPSGPRIQSRVRLAERRPEAYT